MSLMAIDGNNLLSRAIFAAGEGRMTSEDGTDTGSLVLFANMLSTYLRTWHPERVCVCWDSGRSTYRTELYPEYKASRLDRGNTQAERFLLAQEFCTLAGFEQRSFPGVEADDLIAELWRRRDGDFFIVSGDKDFLQLLEDDVWQLRPGVHPEVWSWKTVEQRMGLDTAHLPLYMALTGDAGDDVPGVPRVGPKTAMKVLVESDWDWETALDHPKVKPHRELAEVSRALVDLRNIQVDGVEEVGPFIAPEGERLEALVEFLDRYELERVRERVVDGSYWPSLTP